MKISNFECKQYYKEYINNFITIRFFAEYYGFKLHEAINIITRGRSL